MDVEDERSKHLVPIVVDGANVAFSHGGNSFSPDGITISIDLFRRRGHECFAMLPSRAYAKHPAVVDMVADGRVVLCPSDQDDLFILDYARSRGGFVVSNDRFRDHVSNWAALWGEREAAALQEWTQTRVISYGWRGDEFIPHPVTTRLAMEAELPEHLLEEAQGRVHAQKQREASRAAVALTALQPAPPPSSTTGPPPLAPPASNASFPAHSPLPVFCANPRPVSARSASPSPPTPAPAPPSPRLPFPPWVEDVVSKHYGGQGASDQQASGVMRNSFEPVWMALTMRVVELLHASGLAVLTEAQIQSRDAASSRAACDILLDAGREAAGKVSLLSITGLPPRLRLLVDFPRDAVAGHGGSSSYAPGTADVGSRKDEVRLWSPKRLALLEEGVRAVVAAVHGAAAAERQPANSATITATITAPVPARAAAEGVAPGISANVEPAEIAAPSTTDELDGTDL